ncbi:hypothetical protein QYF61_000744 [Mycteria americana]|uniref:Uncharacterized protein n=1 Tax=Mycteria americana TaxID=33587 RepID=A0AAN7SHU4_MYCAM|nr:hypothetical protein QYF61_000744 [Mycteria americana]
MTLYREGKPYRNRFQNHPFSPDDFPEWPCPFFMILVPQHSQWHDRKSNNPHENSSVACATANRSTSPRASGAKPDNETQFANPPQRTSTPLSHLLLLQHKPYYSLQHRLLYDALRKTGAIRMTMLFVKPALHGVIFTSALDHPSPSSLDGQQSHRVPRLEEMSKGQLCPQLDAAPGLRDIISTLHTGKIAASELLEKAPELSQGRVRLYIRKIKNTLRHIITHSDMEEVPCQYKSDLQPPKALSSWSKITSLEKETKKRSQNNALHLGEEKPMSALESSFVEKHLGVLMNKSNISQQCVPVAKAANQIQVYINTIVASRSGEVVLPSIQRLQDHICGSEINTLEVQKQVQRRATAIISVLEHMTYQERQRKLGEYPTPAVLHPNSIQRSPLPQLVSSCEKHVHKSSSWNLSPKKEEAVLASSKFTVQATDKTARERQNWKAQEITTDYQSKCSARVIRRDISGQGTPHREPKRASADAQVLGMLRDMLLAGKFSVPSSAV